LRFGFYTERPERLQLSTLTLAGERLGTKMTSGSYNGQGRRWQDLDNKKKLKNSPTAVYYVPGTGPDIGAKKMYCCVQCYESRQQFRWEADNDYKLLSTHYLNQMVNELRNFILTILLLCGF